VYFPLIMAAPLHLPRISPREVAVASAIVMVVNQAGVTIGPALSGVLGEFLEMRFVLLLMSFAPLVSVIGALFMGEVKSEPEPAVPAPAGSMSPAG
jgi:hypothetical protein